MFERCSLQDTEIDFGSTRIVRVVQDGAPLADHWEGEAAAQAAEERYLTRYRRAIASDDADTMPLDPHDEA